jgi:mannose-1-phosphate guanylyltransferase
VEAVDLGAVLKIDEFVDKPDEGTAQKNLDVGNYLWNWGMFLFKEYKESFEDY